MLKGKISPVTTFALVLLGILFLLPLTEAQARPHHNYGHHASRHRMVMYPGQPNVAPQQECTFFLLDDCGRSQGYAQTTQRGRYARAAYAQQASNDSWGSSWFGGNSGVLGHAQSMTGMSERGNRSALSRMMRVDPARTPWCAAWANAVLRQSGYSGTGSNMARSFLSYGSGTRSPGQGDIVVLGRRGGGHVGFLVERTVRNGRNYVKVLGGNTSNAVKTAWYPEARVLGYRHPG